MKRLVALLLAIPLACVQAEPIAPVDAATPFAEPPPDEASPFFMAEESPQAAAVLRDALANTPSTGYPRVRTAPGTAFAQMRGFFADLIPSVRLKSSKPGSEPVSLAVDPQDFVVNDQRELDVTYTIRNHSKNMTRLEFPTSQRIEILTKSSSGQVVDRWSDDRAFQREEGIVVINPHERIEYQEKIPTREMRAGAIYNIEASMAAQPDYNAEKTVSPR
jgi:hypothetical protein